MNNFRMHDSIAIGLGLVSVMNERKGLLMLINLQNLQIFLRIMENLRLNFSKKNSVFLVKILLNQHLLQNQITF